MKALNILKWDLTCSIVTSGLVRFFVPILNVVKSKYDGGRVSEGPSLAETEVRKEAFQARIRTRMYTWRRYGPGRELGREAEGVRCRLDRGVESRPRSTVNEYGGGSFASAIAVRWRMCNAAAGGHRSGFEYHCGCAVLVAGAMIPSVDR